MSFIVILICLAVQWFLKFSSARYQWRWADPYCRWMGTRITALAIGHGLFSVILLVVPIILVASIVFTLVYHIFGHVGYLMLSLALLWYCVDVRRFLESSNAAQLFLVAYQFIFAFLFWYFIFGPVGLILYVTVNILRLHFAALSAEDAMRKTVLPDFIRVQHLLDWVPVRLLGLTFALAGHFSSVFNRWMSELFQNISSDDQYRVVSWGEMALQSDPVNMPDAIQLIHRSLIIWLVVMALFSLGFWIG